MPTVNVSALPAGQPATVVDSITGNPEVVARPKRRRFTAAFKQKVLAEADAAKGSGEIGAVLRRHGLYSSHLTPWRQEQEAGIFEGLMPQKRGPETKITEARLEYQKLRRKNKRLTGQLRKAEIVIDAQKKVAALLGRPFPPTETLVMAGLGELIPVVGVKQAWGALNVHRASFYRRKGVIFLPPWSRLHGRQPRRLWFQGNAQAA
jgi:transposase